MKSSAIIAALVSALLIATAPPASAVAAEPACAPPAAGDGYWIDAECVDPLYAAPVIDSQADITDTVASRLVEGHFDGTAASFKIFLPPAASWDGRFFQFTYPLGGQEPPDNVAFGASHGGYTVQTSSTGGYRHIAAAAKFSRTVAADYYGVSAESINGYLYGWSGGSYQVIGAMENTTDVWQGAVPIVQGLPMSIPNNYSIRGLAGFVLANDKDAIVASLRPGGSGDPYATLDRVERAVLREAVGMGIPLQSFEDFDATTNTTTLQAFAGGIRGSDPTYVNDFWDDPRYLGAEQSPLGQRFRDALAANDTLDNRWNLAVLAYHRYQVPTDRSYYTYNQYRDRSGNPIYPQRTFNFGSVISPGVSGSAKFDGQINMKMIAVEGLLDFDAFPWHGDWYGNRVRSALGSTADDNYRIWYTANATHNPYTVPETANRNVGYMPVIYQALVDVAAWAEGDSAPPKSTRYNVDQGQIIVPDAANARRGVQPTADLDANGPGSHRPVAPGKKVKFNVKIQVPQGAGNIVSVEWDPEGDGTFAPVSFRSGKQDLTLKLESSYAQSGTYYPVIRVGSQRQGDAGDTFTVIYNLDRTNITVR